MDEVYSVSRLNNAVKQLLEGSFTTVWVEGEISNFAAPASGHWYFSLKDATAQVRCAMFKGSQRRLGFTPKDGTHVLIRARVSLYENRGEYQLIADTMEERGEGKLRRAFELLKKKLEAAGLFDPAHKKPFPAYPTQIGVITSSTGAAVRDILTALKRRYPAVPVIIYPSLVQGETAAPTIANAIQLANSRNECDVLILARGGGSLEDLWPFNEEIVAQAIYQSQIPIISGIGHEVDFTIADFVADLRAATPTAAAELITPDQMELLQGLRRQQQQLTRQMQVKLQHATQQLAWMQKHLQQQHPKRQLTEKMQRLDFCELTLVQLQKNLINKLNTRLSNAAAKLDALSPLATLSRGFAIATDANQHILHRATDIKTGDALQIRLHIGAVSCVATHIHPK
jgi:exodeoxyribonuclease VII large subunit